MIELNKGVELKKYDSYKQKKQKFPLSTMKVGDFFTVNESDYKSARQMAYAYGRRHGKKFTTSKSGDTITVKRVCVPRK
mgnify:CR=1 FL=1